MQLVRYTGSVGTRSEMWSFMYMSMVSKVLVELRDEKGGERKDDNDGNDDNIPIALVYRSTASPYLVRLNNSLPCSFNFSASVAIVVGLGSDSGSGTGSGSD